MQFQTNELAASQLFVFDPLAWIAGALIAIVTLVILGYSRRNMAGDRDYRRFLINISLTGASALAMVFSNHIVVLFIFWCLANILLVRLMIHKAAWRAARNAGMLALSTFGIGFITLAAGLVVLQQSSGSFYISDIIQNQGVTSSFKGHQVPATVRRLENGVAGDNHAPEMNAAKIAHAIIMIARNIDHLDALARQAQDLLDHVIVALRPIPAAFHLPAINDVADQIEGLALHFPDEIKQKRRLTAACAQMGVGNENRPYTKRFFFGGKHRLGHGPPASRIVRVGTKAVKVIE